MKSCISIESIESKIDRKTETKKCLGLGECEWVSFISVCPIPIVTVFECLCRETTDEHERIKWNYTLEIYPNSTINPFQTHTIQGWTDEVVYNVLNTPESVPHSSSFVIIISMAACLDGNCCHFLSSSVCVCVWKLISLSDWRSNNKLCYRFVLRFSHIWIHCTRRYFNFNEISFPKKRHFLL